LLLFFRKEDLTSLLLKFIKPWRTQPPGGTVTQASFWAESVLQASDALRAESPASLARYSTWPPNGWVVPTTVRAFKSSCGARLRAVEATLRASPALANAPS
jgi:hypothetical protein